MRIQTVFICIFLLLGCAQAPTSVESTAAKNRIGKRFPASAADDQPDKAPMVNSLAMPLYSWSNDASLLANPEAAAKQAATSLKHAETCVAQIARAKSEDQIPGCEGNGMAAGPGIYACDNPFVSHDYGQIMYVLPMTPALHSVALVTGSLTPPAASGGLDRFYTGDKSVDAIVYTFRDDDLGGRATALRSQRIIASGKVQAVDARPLKWKPMKTHHPHACSAQSTAQEVITFWADQLDFLALTYVSSNDPTGQGYVKNGQLTGVGAAAAIASDVVAKTDIELADLQQRLNSKFKNLQISSNDCKDTGAMTMRACLATRLFNSIVGNMGTGNFPTLAWDIPTTVQILGELQLADPQAMNDIDSNEKLMAFLAKAYAADPIQNARALEAYNCMRVIKEQVTALGLHSLGPDPQ